jgi:hypothetical protein
MLDPNWIKSGGFAATIVGFIGNILVLIFQKRLGKLETPLRVVLIVLMMIGSIVVFVGDRIIAAANGPRHMSVAEWSSFSEKMRTFSGEKYTMVQYTDEVEAYQLEAALQSALEKAGWEYSPPDFGERPLGSGLLGVLVIIKDAPDKTTREAAQELVDRLNEKLIMSRWSPSPSMQAEKIAIHIFTRIRVY